MDGAAAGRSGTRLSGEGDSLPQSDGRARAFRRAMPTLLYPRAAHRTWRARGQLLPGVPDRRPIARRSGPLEAAEGRLAEDPRRARTQAAGADRLKAD